MKVPKLKTDFRGYNDSELETKAQSIAALWAISTIFINPTPAMAEMLDAISKYSDSVTAAAEGGRTLIAARKANRKALEIMLRQWAAYAMMVAKGDREILISSGFDLVKENETVDVAAPRLLSVKTGRISGQVIVRATGASGVKSYLHEYTTDPVTETSQWTRHISTRGTFIFDGLKPLQKYAFRTGILGSGDVITYSQVITWIVL